MRLFALADLHLGRAVKKPMDVFGPAWERHAERIDANWRRVVAADDWVLVPGDISWAMKLEDALEDLRFIDALPGRKLLLKGNHDYWWTSRAKVEALLPPSLRLLQNDAQDLGLGLGVVGARGWTPPEAPRATDEDRKIYERELGRLQLSLKAAEGRFDRVVAMIHYPPIYAGLGETGFVPLLRAAGVKACAYGHLHGPDHRYAVRGERDGIRYYFVAADAVDFTPVEIALGEAPERA
ncbi:MAG TPA: metallophosphoesterase [Planctomycetota bacterium]|nr:metallophosphoesterase [Planctomycetota bacterium]